MTRASAWLLHLATVLVGGTGLVYAWMRYLAQPDDPFALVNHPWQPALQHLHVLVAPVLVFAVGLVWRGHVWARLRARLADRRRTGVALVALFFPMAVSGYLLQTASGEGWRRAWIVVHVASSCAWLLAYGVHLLAAEPVEPEPVRAQRRAAAARRDAAGARRESRPRSRPQAPRERERVSVGPGSP